MDTYLVTPEQIALVFPRDEGFDARQAILDSLRRLGLPPWERIEAEAFTGTEGTLLLARPAPPARFRIAAGRPRLRRS